MECTLPYKNKSCRVQLWKKNFDAKPGNLMDNPGYFDVDAVGDVYFTSSSERVAGNQDAHLVKYSSTGTKLWAKYVAGTANTTDVAGKFCFDPSGNIYVAHTVTDINSGIQNTNIMIRKYSPTGAVLGTKYYRGSGNVDDEAVGIFYANNGRIYLGGLTRSTVKRSVMAQYDTGLNLEYTDIMLHPETATFPVTSQETYAIDFIYDAPGNLIYWVGRQEAVYPIYLDYKSSYFIIKYAIPTVPRLANFQNNIQLSIYPNPATDKLTIQSEENLSSVIIYDLQGKIVYQTSESDENSLDIDLNNFNSGTYITKITNSTGNSLTEKFIKL
ncbi:MAG: T9SS type A sorting domain-containing protein [Bacteroidetes bacterium]|nr:T9SS type A sorting domain-containing protein [Bacteroidota bacterium]